MPIDYPRQNLRLAFVHKLLERLGEREIPFAIIHDVDDLISALESDLDLAVGELPEYRFQEVLLEVAQNTAMRLCNSLHYEVPHGHYYILATRDKPCAFVHLDCLYDPVGINRYMVPTPFLLRDPILVAGFPQTRADRRATYLLIKRAFKSQMDYKRIQQLRTLLLDNRAEVAAHLEAVAGCRADDVIATLISQSSDAKVAEHLRYFRSRIQWAFRRHPTRIALRWWLTMRRIVGRFLRPTGYFVVLVGPDGCGKSTVATELLTQLGRGFRRTEHFHLRPGLLPKLSNKSATRAEFMPKSAPITDASRRWSIVSVFRFLYYSLDFIAGYWLRIYPQLTRSTLIVAERYFADVLVNPGRYGFTVSPRLLKFVASLVPKPDLTVLLANEPEIIHKRKSELPIEIIRDQLAKFEAEVPRWGEHVSVTTDVPLAEVAAIIADRILALCENRTLARLASDLRHG